MVVMKKISQLEKNVRKRGDSFRNHKAFYKNFIKKVLTKLYIHAILQKESDLGILQRESCFVKKTLAHLGVHILRSFHGLDE